MMQIKEDNVSRTEMGIIYQFEVTGSLSPQGDFLQQLVCRYKNE
jgi:hypothetical protein